MSERKCGDPYHDSESISSRVYDECPSCKSADEKRPRCVKHWPGDRLSCPDCEKFWSGVNFVHGPDDEKPPREWRVVQLSDNPEHLEWEAGEFVRKAERDEYRRAISQDYISNFHHERHVDQIRKERDEWIARYRNIELANKEMSRNDHVVFGELLIERDQLTARVASLTDALERILAQKYEDHANGIELAATQRDIARQALARKPGGDE